MTFERVNRWVVSALGLACFLAGIHWSSDVAFLTEHWRIIIEHSLMGIMFTLTGVFLRGMCEHTKHKLLLGAVLILAEAVFTVAVIG